MEKDKEALALELRQIIQADRMASDVIKNAEDLRKSIEKRTEKEKAALLAETERQRQKITRQVEAEQAATLVQRKAEAAKKYNAQREKITQQMEQNSEMWIQEITARIIAARPTET